MIGYSRKKLPSTIYKNMVAGRNPHIKMKYPHPSGTASYLACIRYLFDLDTQNVNKHDNSVAEFI